MYSSGHLNLLDLLNLQSLDFDVLHGGIAIKLLGDLFQCTSFGFNEEEVDSDDLEHVSEHIGTKE